MDIKMISRIARNQLLKDIFKAFSGQLNLAEDEINLFRNEAFLLDADEEHIDKWEKFMNLEEKQDYTLEDRIERVLFTIQSRGSFTPAFLKEQAKIFMNGIIEVEELFNEYLFTIVFKDIIGIPPNLENFKDMLELNKPAHLNYKFKFRYNTHGQLEILTHGEMEQYTHDELYQKRVFDDSQLPTQNFLMKAVNTVKNAVEALIYPLKTDYYNVDIFNDNFRYLDEHKLEKGAYVGNADDLNDEISKVASPTQLGRVKVGNNLKIDEDGILSGQDVDLSNYYDKPEIEEKFKNFCPYSIGDIYITTLSTNPAVRFLGTTWEKIEGRFLLSTNGSNASGQLGGSNAVTISKENLPNIKLQIDSFSLGKGTQEITGQFTAAQHKRLISTGAFSTVAQFSSGFDGRGDYNDIKTINFTASKSWTGMSTSASPYTSSLGSGTPLDITPAYYTVHIWKRLT